MYLLGATKTIVYTTILKEYPQNDTTIKMFGRIRISMGDGGYTLSRGQYGVGGT